MLAGAGDASFATLVERSTRFVMSGQGAVQAQRRRRTRADRQGQELLEQLQRPLTWERGKEMAQHARFNIDTGVKVCFCDPKGHWQRGSKENTTGLLRQYFPERSSLTDVTQQPLDVVAELNGRPRQTLGFRPPSRQVDELLR